MSRLGEGHGTPVRASNGRWMRAYFTGVGDPIAVTYWRRRGARLRQLSVSPKLMRKVLR